MLERSHLGLDDEICFRIGFLLIPGFSLLPYASTIEPLRAANQLAGRNLFTWLHMSHDGKPVTASNGVTIPPDLEPRDFPHLDMVFVCAGTGVEGQDLTQACKLLRHLASMRVPLGGISGGPYVLACAGLLEEHRVTVHWDHIAGFAERFHTVEMTGKLYEIDRDRVTCSGGIAPLDLMHELIARWCGTQLSSAVSDWFIHGKPRESGEPQRLEVLRRSGPLHRKLLKVLSIMEEQLEEPVCRDDLARAAGLSLRQLERLFENKLNTTIGQHYLELRLARARTLLQQTVMSVLEIAVATGFVSPTHFSRAYRQRFGHPPTHERREGRRFDRSIGAFARAPRSPGQPGRGPSLPAA